MPTAAGRSKKRFPGAFFTTCDWADKFCVEIGEQFAGWSPRRISAPDTTARHYGKRLTKGEVDPKTGRRLKKPTESVALSDDATRSANQLQTLERKLCCLGRFEDEHMTLAHEELLREFQDSSGWFFAHPCSLPIVL
jgi:hypothetical protein